MGLARSISRILHLIMCGHRELFNNVFLFVCATSVLCDPSLASSQNKRYTIRLPQQSCSLCSGHAQMTTSSCPDGRTMQQQVRQLTHRLTELKVLMDEGGQNATSFYGAEDDFLPVNITALRRGFECKKVQRFVHRKSKLERLIKTTYIRLLILLGHLEISNDILERDLRYVNGQGQKSSRLLQDILCKVFDLSMNMGTGPVKIKVCKTLNKIFKGSSRHCSDWHLDIESNTKEERDYALSIVQQGQTVVQNSIHELNEVDGAFNLCSCAEETGLQCPREEGMEKRSLQRKQKKSRKGRKNRKGRRKGRKNKKNRKVNRRKGGKAVKGEKRSKKQRNRSGRRQSNQ